MDFQITLPTLSHFRNGNGWIGSAGRLRFQIEPPVAGPGGPDDLTATVALWEGPFSRTYSQETGRETFPVTEDGLRALADYLTLAARRAREQPVYTDGEAMAYYRAQKAREETERSE